MQNFCPLCMKNGIKRRVKAFQINLEEAVWACPGEECIWPLDHDVQDLTFFKRNAITYDWKESDLLKENIPVSMELSLYTPPVTPGRIELSNELNDNGMMVENLTNSSIEDKIDEMFPEEELIHLKRELANSNKLSLLDPLELENNLTEKSINITKQGNASLSSFKIQPKVTDIQKTNIDLTIFSSVDECCNKQKLQKFRQLSTDTNNITDIIKNCDILFDNTFFNKLDLNTQCEIESKQNKNNIMQLDDVANQVEKFSPQMLLEATQTIDSSIMSLVATDNSILNTSESYLNFDAILEDFFNDENI
ncbi:uncharacterized protein [Linepithema humile]|uniref:uncharacterized protein n=1 Tax=Linepithema humile TaxID=83485 RepID=UPI000622FFDD|nr:PREDICTED: uncharacterized protein LOC105667473 [Linepithema humile]XP_012214708.1 PREDICTED: uncharacterized protein LOC105667473 [Linepithema humile]XP_012214710.1 PREDICTED: uncharacterized protein LOC105667473 [Linepithema humile]XP_012214711.1 PREDICTED: uncharacterized protein LOC105667473 [Linepithema humile]